MQSRKYSGGRNFEYGTTALKAGVYCPVKRSAVEVSICALDQTGGRITAFGGRSREAVEHGECALGIYFEDGSPAVRTAVIGCPVKIPVDSLDDSCIGIFPVEATKLLLAKTVYRGELPRGRDFENRTSREGSVSRCGPVEVAVRAFDQSCVRIAPVRTVRLRAEVIECANPALYNLINRAASLGAGESA